MIPTLFAYFLACHPYIFLHLQCFYFLLHIVSPGHMQVFYTSMHSFAGRRALVRGVCSKSQCCVVPGAATEAIRPELHHLQAGTFVSVTL